MGWSTSFGHAWKHSPHRMHFWRNSSSATLPGGRTGRSFISVPATFAPQIRLMPTTEAAPASVAARKPRREGLVSFVCGSSSFFRSVQFKRSTNLIECVGQTPPQVWQSVQSSVRVVKSALMASNGQTSTHLLHLMQEDSTFRSVERKRFPSEKTAPEGQTYWHQNRRRKSPRKRIPRKSTIETIWPQFQGGTWYHPRSALIWNGFTRKSMARVTIGMAATNPVRSTPKIAAIRHAART